MGTGGCPARALIERMVCDPALDVGDDTPDVEVDPSVMATRTRTQRDPKRDDLRRLGERIREQRRTKGMTQENLAQSLDLSVAYVSLIERGGRNPPYTTVLAIARALGVIAGRDRHRGLAPRQSTGRPQLAHRPRRRRSGRPQPGQRRTGLRAGAARRPSPGGGRPLSRRATRSSSAAIRAARAPPALPPTREPRCAVVLRPSRLVTRGACHGRAPGQRSGRGARRQRALCVEDPPGACYPGPGWRTPEVARARPPPSPPQQGPGRPTRPRRSVAPGGAARCAPRGAARAGRSSSTATCGWTRSTLVGFDMDYTLAIYHQRQMEDALVRDDAGADGRRARLPGRRCASCRYDPEFVDPRPGHRQALGNIFKMDRYNHVRPRYHGRRPLARRGAEAPLPRREDPPRDAALRLDRHPLRAPRGLPLRRDRRAPGGPRARRSTTPSSSTTSASASTRSTATDSLKAERPEGPAPLRRARTPSWARRCTSCAPAARSSSCSPTRSGTTPTR